MKNFLSQKAKVIQLSLLIFPLTIGSWLFAARMIARNQGSMITEHRRVLESNWGADIIQTAPELTAKYQYTPGIDPTKPRPDVAVRNVRIIQSDVDATIRMDYRRKGLTYFPTYITNFSGIYTVKNENEEAIEAFLAFPLPREESLIWDVEIHQNNSEEGTDINTKRLTWEGDMEPGEEKNITIKYKARGLDNFSYALTQGQGLQNFTLDIIVNGANAIDFPQGALSPSSIVERQNGWDLHWKFDKVLSSPSITVKLFTKQNISSQVAKLFWFAPILLVAFLASIGGLNLLHKKSLGVFDYILLGTLYFMFYPFLAYLVSVFDTLTVLQGLAISFAVISLVVMYIYMHIFGVKFALTTGLPLQGIFLGFFPFALLSPQLTGFLGISGVIAILAVVAKLRLDYRKTPRKQ